MSKELIEKEFEKLFPKEDVQAYRSHLVEKLGEEEVEKIEKLGSVVVETLNELFFNKK